MCVVIMYGKIVALVVGSAAKMKNCLSTYSHSDVYAVVFDNNIAHNRIIRIHALCWIITSYLLRRRCSQMNHEIEYLLQQQYIYRFGVIG